jgi:hypothetical protein
MRNETKDSGRILLGDNIGDRAVTAAGQVPVCWRLVFD